MPRWLLLWVLPMVFFALATCSVIIVQLLPGAQTTPGDKPALAAMIWGSGIIMMIGWATSDTCRRFGPLDTWFRLIKECGKRYEDEDEQAHDEKAAHYAVRAFIAEAELRIFRAARTRSSGRMRRRRKRELAEHAGRVITRLRQAEMRLDSEQPEAALAELADLSAEISVRYASGRIGALLPSMADIEPVRRWTLLRLGSAATLGLGAGIALAVAGQADIAPWAGAGIGALALMCLFGSRYTQMLPSLRHIVHGQ